VVVIDDDLGHSGSGAVERAGFGRLLEMVCVGDVGAVFALEASRLARNNREWHHLVDLCALAETLVVDYDGVYDPRLLNDRLLLGLKGTMSEFELSLMRQRAKEAFLDKVRRGAVMTRVPAGYVRTSDNRIEKHPSERVQQAVTTVFELFAELGSARQVLLDHQKEGRCLPSEYRGETIWVQPTYSRVLAFLTNPTYAGSLVYGRRRRERCESGGIRRQSRTLLRDPEEWQIVIHEHHEGYLGWDDFQRHQRQLQENTASAENQRGGAVKRGEALLSGLMRCGRCGRAMYIRYRGRRQRFCYYECMGAIQNGRRGCLTVAAAGIDKAVSDALLEAISPAALEVALASYEDGVKQTDRHLRALELALEQARYEVERARRQYDAVEPENRLVAAELERRWERALAAAAEAEAALADALEKTEELNAEDRSHLLTLAEDLPYVWNHEGAAIEIKKRILRCVLTGITVNTVEDPPRSKLELHWAGGVQTTLSVRRNRIGEHGHCTDREVVELVRELAIACDDRIIAQVLNRLGYNTGAGNPFNVARVQSLRQYHKIGGFSEGDRDWLTLEETAEKLEVSQGTVRKLVHCGIMEGRQIVKYAPWMIPKEALETAAVQAAVASVQTGEGVPMDRSRQPELVFATENSEV
jgi:DNA invertase Pin-like site-specific DNA recombinase